MDDPTIKTPDTPAVRPPAARRRLHAPVAAALAGLGIVAGANDAGAIVARPDVVVTTINTQVNNLDVIANDTYTYGAGVDFVSVGPTTAGTFQLVPGSPRPTLNFKPTPGFVGARIVPYCIADVVSNGCSYLYVSVQNTAAVVASDDFYATAHNTPLRNLQVLANDSYFNPFNLEISHLLKEQAAGNASVSPDSAGGYGTWQPTIIVPAGPANAQSWMLDYTPPPGFAGTDSFQYCIGGFFTPGSQTCATVYVNVSAYVHPEPIPALGGFGLAGLSGVLGWLAMRLRRRG
ncbi:MAG: Ig-like domain-containing protein [Vicinamibacteria bacterium]|jgi:hypothetical protein